MKITFFRIGVALNFLTLLAVLAILFFGSGCAASSRPVPQITTQTQGLVIEQSSDFGPIGLDALAQFVLRNDGDGVQLTFRWRGNSVIVTRGQGCLWNWTATVNNTGGSVCIKNPAELVRQEIANHNPYKIPSLVTVDTYGVPLPQMPEHRYLVGVASDYPGSRVDEREMTIPEIRGLVRKVQDNPDGGTIYFPSPREFSSYSIRLYMTAECVWGWEHRSANGEIFAQGTVIDDCNLASSDMIPFMLEWR